MYALSLTCAWKTIATSAFYETMRRTALYQWEQLFSGFSVAVQAQARELYVHMIEHRGRYDDQEDETQLEKAYAKEEAALPAESFYVKMPQPGTNGGGSSQAWDLMKSELEASNQSVADLKLETKMLKEKLAKQIERSRGLSYGMDFPTSMGGSELTDGSTNPMLKAAKSVKRVRNPLNIWMHRFRARSASTPQLGRPDQFTSANPMFVGEDEGEWQRFEENGVPHYWNELLPSWFAYDDEEGQRYYFNSETRETTYDMPKPVSTEDGSGGSTIGKASKSTSNIADTAKAIKPVRNPLNIRMHRFRARSASTPQLGRPDQFTSANRMISRGGGGGGSTTEKASESTSSLTSPVSSSRIKAVAKRMTGRFSVRSSLRSQRNISARRKDKAQSPADRQQLEATATTDWVSHKTRESMREQLWAADNAAVLAAAKKAKASSQTSLQAFLEEKALEVLDEDDDSDDEEPRDVVAPSIKVGRARPNQLELPRTNTESLLL